MLPVEIVDIMVLVILTIIDVANNICYASNATFKGLLVVSLSTFRDSCRNTSNATIIILTSQRRPS